METPGTLVGLKRWPRPSPGCSLSTGGFREWRSWFLPELEKQLRGLDPFHHPRVFLLFSGGFSLGPRLSFPGSEGPSAGFSLWFHQATKRTILTPMAAEPLAGANLRRRHGMNRL